MNPGQRLEAILIGIVNFGRKNCTTILITPTVFANVGFHRNWIDAKLQIWTIIVSVTMLKLTFKTVITVNLKSQNKNIKTNFLSIIKRREHRKRGKRWQCSVRDGTAVVYTDCNRPHKWQHYRESVASFSLPLLLLQSFTLPSFAQTTQQMAMQYKRR